MKLLDFIEQRPILASCRLRKHFRKRNGETMLTDRRKNSDCGRLCSLATHCKK
jgi:hypothetical protein